MVVLGEWDIAAWRWDKAQIALQNPGQVYCISTQETPQCKHLHSKRSSKARGCNRVQSGMCGRHQETLV